jgi:hypothetical protein
MFILVLDLMFKRCFMKFLFQRQKFSLHTTTLTQVLNTVWLGWLVVGTNIRHRSCFFNPLTPSGLTAPLTSKVTFYIFIEQILVLNILNMVYTFRFFIIRMQFVS